MTSDFIHRTIPRFSDDLSSGTIRNDPILKKPGPYDGKILTPLIPQLEGGPATGGWCRDDFWNKPVLEEILNGIAKPDPIELVKLEGIFEGFSQIFMVNRSNEKYTGWVILDIEGFRPFQLGYMPPGGIWTTTVPMGKTASFHIGEPALSTWLAH